MLLYCIYASVFLPKYKVLVEVFMKYKLYQFYPTTLLLLYHLYVTGCLYKKTSQVCHKLLPP